LDLVLVVLVVPLVFLQDLGGMISSTFISSESPTCCMSS
jgi:hypothetical protein